MQTAYRGRSDDSARNYLREISQFPVLSRAEEVALIPAAKAGDQSSLDTVIRANLRFVSKIANEYADKGMPLIDLIGEGNLGLFRAIESFDPARGLKFITYAKWWVRQSIVHALIYKNHLVRLPQSQLRRLRRTNKVIDAMARDANRTPTEYEIEASLDGADSSAWMMSKYISHQHSLDAPLGHDGSDNLLDVLPDSTQISPDADLQAESMKSEIEEALSLLKQRETDIVRRLFGLATGKKMTLEEVGAIYGISKERVRQIREEALNKLRSSKVVTDSLRLYLN
jgi:RNA polymerase primary sigma factor